MEEKQKKKELQVEKFHTSSYRSVWIGKASQPKCRKSYTDHKVVNRKIDSDGANNLFIISLHVT